MRDFDSLEWSDAPEVAEVHPDEKRLADDVLLRNETPEPAVEAVLAIVAHHEIVTGRHRARHPPGRVTAVLVVREAEHRLNVRRFFQVCQYLMADISDSF